MFPDNVSKEYNSVSVLSLSVSKLPFQRIKPDVSEIVEFKETLVTEGQYIHTLEQTTDECRKAGSQEYKQLQSSSPKSVYKKY